MFKSIIFISLIFGSLASFAEDGPSNAMIVKKIISSNQQFEIYRGTRFERIKKELDRTFINLKLNFKMKNDNFYNSPRKIAQGIYLDLFKSDQPTVSENASSNEIIKNSPFPCGYVRFGKDEQKQINATTYTIRAEGDGFYDTCTKTGAPGSWVRVVKVKYDYVTKTGILEIESYDE